MLRVVLDQVPVFQVQQRRVQVIAWLWTRVIVFRSTFLTFLIWAIIPLVDAILPVRDVFLKLKIVRTSVSCKNMFSTASSAQCHFVTFSWLLTCIFSLFWSLYCCSLHCATFTSDAPKFCDKYSKSGLRTENMLVLILFMQIILLILLLLIVFTVIIHFGPMLRAYKICVQICDDYWLIRHQIIRKKIVVCQSTLFFYCCDDLGLVNKRSD